MTSAPDEMDDYLNEFVRGYIEAALEGVNCFKPRAHFWDISHEGLQGIARECRHFVEDHWGILNRLQRAGLPPSNAGWLLYYGRNGCPEFHCQDAGPALRDLAALMTLDIAAEQMCGFEIRHRRDADGLECVWKGPLP